MTSEAPSLSEGITPGHGESPRATPALRLRTVLLLLLLGAVAYAAGLSVYLALRVGSAARALGQGTESFVALLEDQQRRAEALHQAADLATTALRARASSGSPVLDSVKHLATVGSVRLRAQPFAAVTTRQRVLLARSDEQMSSLGNVLIEAGALVELARWASAERRLRLAHELSDSVAAMMSLASAAGSGDLLARQEELRRAVDQAWRAAVVWLAVGVGLLPLALAVIRRRIWRPLTALEAGLARVSEGDLAAQVPVTRADELGRVTDHFNAMTRVLRERAEEQGRFAAAGELLAGVAHEVNNPLMTIAVHAESRLAEAGLDAQHRKEMEQILRQARRASKLLRGMLRFVRPHERHVVARVNLNDIARRAVDLVSYRFAVDEIELGGSLDPKLPETLCDAIGLEQVMVNLLSNAIDALRAVPSPRRLIVESWTEEGQVQVAVADNGPGVPASFRRRLFKPFATTKGVRGTGLGLYISRQIVREAGGDLRLASQPHQSARFVLSLPALSSVPADGAPVAAKPPVSAPSLATAPAAAGTLAGLRILVVDDEEPIRRILARFLARQGAHVLEAADGQDALDQLQDQAVDLIIADLRMPRMTGVQLHARLKATHALLADRMLLMSGDISQLAEPGAMPIPRERVLDKPVGLEQLERRILEFLAAVT